ncbi:MAG: hypothetical protein J3T61_00035 [Candidatus Brocadiales bacterium]|nr:hypothetical protein [Candidatus Bathyanammoxibius sp.]
MVEKTFEVEIERFATIRVTIEQEDVPPGYDIKEMAAVWAEECARDCFFGDKRSSAVIIEDDIQIDQIREVSPQPVKTTGDAAPDQHITQTGRLKR